MPPRVKFQKEEIVAAALDVVRKKGIDAVTAREVAAELSVSPRPIFTWFNTMEQLKAAVFEMAKGVYREYVERGLSGPIPFLGVGQQYVRFAKEEPELYKLLFLTKPDEAVGGAMEALRLSQSLPRFLSTLGMLLKSAFDVSDDSLLYSNSCTQFKRICARAASGFELSFSNADSCSAELMSNAGTFMRYRESRAIMR